MYMKKNVAYGCVLISIAGVLLKIRISHFTYIYNEGQLTGTRMQLVSCILASVGGIFMKIHVPQFKRLRYNNASFVVICQ